MYSGCQNFPLIILLRSTSLFYFFLWNESRVTIALGSYTYSNVSYVKQIPLLVIVKYIHTVNLSTSNSSLYFTKFSKSTRNWHEVWPSMMTKDKMYHQFLAFEVGTVWIIKIEPTEVHKSKSKWFGLNKKSSQNPW